MTSSTLASLVTSSSSPRSTSRPTCAEAVADQLDELPWAISGEPTPRCLPRRRATRSPASLLPFSDLVIGAPIGSSTTTASASSNSRSCRRSSFVPVAFLQPPSSGGLAADRRIRVGRLDSTTRRPLAVGCLSPRPRQPDDHISDGLDAGGEPVTAGVGRRGLRDVGRTTMVSGGRYRSTDHWLPFEPLFGGLEAVTAVRRSRVCAGDRAVPRPWPLLTMSGPGEHLRNVQASSAMAGRAVSDDAGSGRDTRPALNAYDDAAPAVERGSCVVRSRSRDRVDRRRSTPGRLAQLVSNAWLQRSVAG